MISPHRRNYQLAFLLGAILSIALDIAYMAVASSELMLPEMLRHTKTVAAILIAFPSIVINIHQAFDGWRLYDLLAYILSGLYFILLYRAAINIRHMASGLWRKG